MDNNSLAHSRYNCTYHIVFIPKYRRKVMFGELRKDVGEILGKVCRMEGVTIIKAATLPDHVHMYVSIPPKLSVSKAVGLIKGKTTKEVKDKLKPKSLSLKSTKIDTLKSYGLNWLRTVKALELEARTYDEYENIIEKRIGNHSIGSRQLHSITSNTWQSYINELSGKYALGTIKKTWNVIKQIVAYAEAKGDIHEGTLKLVRLPKESNVAVKTKEIPFIDEADMNILYNEAFHTIGSNNRCMYGNASKLLVLIMYTGLRVSEACALRWEDVNISNKTLRVQSSLSKVKERSTDRQSVKNKDGTTKYKIVSKAPKTGNSIRTIPLPQRAVEILEYFEKLNPDHKPADYICLTDAGKPYEKKAG